MLHLDKKTEAPRGKQLLKGTQVGSIWPPVKEKGKWPKPFHEQAQMYRENSHLDASPAMDGTGLSRRSTDLRAWVRHPTSPWAWLGDPLRPQSSTHRDKHALPWSHVNNGTGLFPSRASPANSELVPGPEAGKFSSQKRAGWSRSTSIQTDSPNWGVKVGQKGRSPCTTTTRTLQLPCNSVQPTGTAAFPCPSALPI